MAPGRTPVAWALEQRGLIKRTWRGSGHVAVVTADGRYYLKHGKHPRQVQAEKERLEGDSAQAALAPAGGAELVSRLQSASGAITVADPGPRTRGRWRTAYYDALHHGHVPEGHKVRWNGRQRGADGNVLDLAAPGKDDTRIVLREYDDSAESQRWRLVPAEPERTSDHVLGWAPLSHWNSRQSWRLTHSRTALRPAPDATPSFSNVLLVLEKFGCDQDAGGWKTDRSNHHPAGQAGRWAGLGERFLADTTGTGSADIVGLKPAKGAVTSSGRGDGRFDDEERVLHAPASSATPSDLWTIADLTGENRPGVVVLSAEGVRVSAQDEGGRFAPAGGKLVLKAFGHGTQAGGWIADKHPRFLADTTGDGRLDIVGCHNDGLWVSLQDEEGAFAEPLYVLDDFGVAQGWSSIEECPRFLVRTVGDGPLDIVGFGPQGVVLARGRGDGTFEPSQLVLNDYGRAQGWTGEKHLRLLADVTGDGNPDIIGFGNEGVWVSHNSGGGRFKQAQLVCRGFGYNDDAGGWRVDRHRRFLTDITGDGRVDIVGFGGPGVHVARNLFRQFRTR
ncbi:FG-GAP repeat domain-containing protein [Streptomyces anulatus]|uniref:FG-GAP repeat domain-containing protein n=1 Tax=Streptomyces anulatus TaxID=1892 RepID=UPI003F4CD01E